MRDQADPTHPLSRGLSPRHLRAANLRVFVHVQISAQTAPTQGAKGKNSIKKFVQNCAALCSENCHIEKQKKTPVTAVSLGGYARHCMNRGKMITGMIEILLLFFLIQPEKMWAPAHGRWVT
ncbi:hypothetical protein [Symbiopectobacterium purcellii]|uniref:hypothetical protein n=1 Tax=Symbiopectobacterium purcellii TaxID=2871826 RepID=UPI003F8425AA